MMPVRAEPRNELSTNVIQPHPFVEYEPEDELRSFLGALQRRRKLFLSIVFSFVVLVVIWTVLLPKKYTTTAKLMSGISFQNQDPQQQQPMMNALLGTNAGQTPETYIELIQEEPVVKKVIETFHLDTTPAALLRKVNAQPVPNTSVIELDVTWSDPTTSANIANEFASVFVDRERDIIASQADSALTYLSKNIPQAEDELRKANKALAQFEQTHTAAFINSQTQSAFTTIAGIEQKIGQVQVDLNQAQAQVTSVRSQMSGMSATEESATNVAQNPVQSALQTQLAQVEVQLQSARAQYTEQHPTVIGLQQQKAQLERQIASLPSTVVSGTTSAPNPTYKALDQQAAGLTAQIASDNAQLTTLNKQRADFNRSARSLPTDTLQLANLQRHAKLTESVATALQTRYNNAVVGKAASLSDVAVTQAATAESASIRPKLLLNTALAIVIGLVLAFGGVFLVEYFDNTFKVERDVTRALGLPVLAEIPQITAESRKVLPWLQAMTFEAFLQIVTALRYSSDKPLRTLAITSPAESDGKSTLAINLAVALAEVTGDVLLVDVDLRRPTLHSTLGLPLGRGLSDVLIGAAKATDLAIPTKYEGLDLLRAGVQVPHPLRLLQSENFDRAIAELLARYKLIVFDTPAVIPVLDAAVVSAKSDGVVMVAAAGKTDSRAVRRALQRLSTVGPLNFLGVVLNRVNPSRQDGALYGHYYAQDGHPFPLTDEVPTQAARDSDDVEAGGPDARPSPAANGDAGAALQRLPGQLDHGEDRA